jgi:ABC-type molybdate transport system permease subunit
MPDKNNPIRYLDTTSSDPKVIQATGEVKVKLVVIWVVAGLILLLILGTFIYPCVKSDTSFKDVWSFTGPVISAAIVALVGYVANNKQK